MSHLMDRRRLLRVSCTAVLLAAAGMVAAQSTNIRGAIQFADGSAIPEGQIEIYLEDSADRDNTQHRVAKTQISSDGGSKMIAFSLPSITNAIAPSSTLQVIARLERADGWLLARGSAQLDDGMPVSITLHTAMY